MQPGDKVFYSIGIDLGFTSERLTIASIITRCVGEYVEILTQWGSKRVTPIERLTPRPEDENIWYAIDHGWEGI